jgi:hypothetical protein
MANGARCLMTSILRCKAFLCPSYRLNEASGTRWLWVQVGWRCACGGRRRPDGITNVGRTTTQVVEVTVGWWKLWAAGGLLLVWPREWESGCVVGCSSRVLLVGSGVDRDLFLRSWSSPPGPQERNTATRAIATTTTNKAVERGDTFMVWWIWGTMHWLKALKGCIGAQSQIRNTDTSE